MRFMTILIATLWFLASTQASDNAAGSPEMTQKTNVAVDAKTFSIKINPAYLLVSELSLALEIRLGNFTLGPIASYAPEHAIFSESDENPTNTSSFSNERYSTYGYGLQSKYYFRGLDQNTPYVGALARFSSITVKLDRDSVVYSGQQDFIEIGVMAGYQWNWSQFTFNAGGGIKNLDAQGDFKFRSSDGDSLDRKAFGNNFASLVLDFGFGYSF